MDETREERNERFEELAQLSDQIAGLQARIRNLVEMAEEVHSYLNEAGDPEPAEFGDYDPDWNFQELAQEEIGDLVSDMEEDEDMWPKANWEEDWFISQAQEIAVEGLVPLGSPGAGGKAMEVLPEEMWPQPEGEETIDWHPWLEWTPKARELDVEPVPARRRYSWDYGEDLMVDYPAGLYVDDDFGSEEMFAAESKAPWGEELIIEQAESMGPEAVEPEMDLELSSEPTAVLQEEVEETEALGDLDLESSESEPMDAEPSPVLEFVPEESAPEVASSASEPEETAAQSPLRLRIVNLKTVNLRRVKQSR